MLVAARAAHRLERDAGVLVVMLAAGGVAQVRRRVSVVQSAALRAGAAAVRRLAAVPVVVLETRASEQAWEPHAEERAQGGRGGGDDGHVDLYDVESDTDVVVRVLVRVVVVE